jgi:hypothetical protein
MPPANYLIFRIFGDKRNGLRREKLPAGSESVQCQSMEASNGREAIRGGLGKLSNNDA